MPRSETDEQGKYHYNTKSKASWYWSRSWGATRRLKCKYYVFTDWNRWVFGLFDDEGKHGWVSPVIPNDSQTPTATQSLLYWCLSAKGEPNGFKPELKDVGETHLFPDNPARRVSHVGGTGEKKEFKKNQVKTANESDVSVALGMGCWPKVTELTVDRGE